MEIRGPPPRFFDSFVAIVTVNGHCVAHRSSFLAFFRRGNKRDIEWSSLCSTLLCVRLNGTENVQNIFTKCNVQMVTKSAREKNILKVTNDLFVISKSFYVVGSVEK